MADALAATVAAAPEQWYSFKPIWPATREEAADLERRATADAGRAIAGPGGRAAASSRLTDGRADRRLARQRAARPCSAASWLACRLPERPARRARGARRRPLVPRRARRGPPRRAGTSRGSPRPRGARPGHRRRARGRDDPRRSSGSSGAPSGTRPATTSRWRGRPAIRPATSTTRPRRDAGGRRRRLRAGPAGRSSWASTSAPSSCPALFLADARRRPRSRRWRPSPTRSSRTGSCGRAGRVGLRIVGLREARRELLAALRDGRAVGLVGDRDLTGGGMPTDVFGAPAPLPARAGAAGARDRRARLRRRRPADAARALPRAPRAVAVPADGTRRERVTATSPAMAAGLRARIAGRPRAVVGGLLPDLAGPRGASAPPTAGPGRRAEAGGRHDRPPRPRRPAHPHRSHRTARRTSSRSSTTSRGAPSSTSSPSPTTSGSTPRSRPGRSPATGASLRGRRRRGGHDARRPPARAVPRAPIRPLRSLRATIADVHDAGRPRDPRPSARALPAVRPGLGPAPPPRRPRRGRPPRRPRDVQPDGARPAVARSRRALRRRPRARPRRQQRRPCPRRDRPPAGRRSRAGPPTTCAAAIGAARRPTTAARSTARPARSASFGQQLAQARPRRSRRSRAAGSARRHRARPRLPGRPRRARPGYDAAADEERR